MTGHLYPSEPAYTAGCQARRYADNEDVIEWQVRVFADRLCPANSWLGSIKIFPSEKDHGKFYLRRYAATSWRAPDLFDIQPLIWDLMPGEKSLYLMAQATTTSLHESPTA
jgi:hypothetical protein